MCARRSASVAPPGSEPDHSAASFSRLPPPTTKSSAAGMGSSFYPGGGGGSGGGGGGVFERAATDEEFVQAAGGGSHALGRRSSFSLFAFSRCVGRHRPAPSRLDDPVTQGVFPEHDILPAAAAPPRA